MNPTFQDEVVVVVGAASGIGRAIAQEFAAGGARVCGLDKAEANLTALASQFQVDATDYSHLQQIASAVRASFGGVDHLVVSIGMCSGTFGFPFWNLDPGCWAQAVNVNLIAPVNVAHAFVPCMVEAQRGTVCFVTSVAGQIGSQTDPPYSAAKAGLINFTQCAAKDLAQYHIRVNAVSPGMVKTPMNKQVWQAWRDRSPTNSLSYDQWAESKIKQVSPLGCWQTPEDVAKMVCFLASPNASNVTGQTLNVDGGQVMHS